METTLALGRDPEGRFALASRWLESSGFRAAPVEAPSLTAINLDPDLQLWRSKDSSAEPTEVRLIDTWTVEVVAMGLAAAFLLGCLLFRQRTVASSSRTLLVFLGFCAIVSILAPTPFQNLGRIPGGVGLFVGLVRLIRAGFQRTLLKYATALATTTALCLLVLLSGQAAGPGEHLVWVLPGGKPGEQAVLVAPTLLDQLRSLASKPPYHLDGAVLTAADYDGVLNGDFVDLQITYSIQVFTEKAARLSLPLSGGELLSATLDGQPAYPEAVPPPGVGYLLQVEGKGAHQLVLRVQARVASSEAGSELRLAIPELMLCKAVLSLPVTMSDPVSALGRGRQRLDRNPQRVQLQLDLGRSTQLNVRWRDTSKKLSQALPRLNELYYWDLQESGSKLLAIWRYSGFQGSSRQLSWKIPAHLVVRHVETRALGAATAPRLRDWHVEENSGKRTLHMELSRTGSSNFQILAELARDRELQPMELLELPLPEQVECERGSVAFRALGFRANVESRGLTGQDLAAFTTAWQTTGIEDPGPADAAFRFLRGATGAPFLQVNLQRRAATPQATQEVAWRLLPREALVTVSLRVTRSGGSWNMVEWDVPAGLQVIEVRGNELWTWSQTGTRVQAWLTRPRSEVSLEWSGRRTLQGQATETKHELTAFPIRGVSDVRTRLTVATEPAFLLEAKALAGLAAVESAPALSPQHTYRAAQPAWRGTFVVHSAPLRGEAQCLMNMRLQNSSVEWRALLHLQIRQGNGRHLRVHVRHAGTNAWQASARSLLTAKAERISSVEVVYTLDLESGSSQEQWITFSSRAALDSRAAFTVPEISVEELTMTERWLAARAEDWQLENPQVVTRVPNPAAVTRKWLGHADVVEAGASVWRFQQPDSVLFCRPRSQASESAAFEIVHLERQSEAGTSVWRHQLTIWGFQERDSWFHVSIPLSARVLAVLVDAQLASSWYHHGGSLSILMEGAQQPRTLTIRWEEQIGERHQDSLKLATPVISMALSTTKQARLKEMVRVLAPLGYSLQSTAPPSAMVTPESLDFARIAALGRLSERLARIIGDRKNPALEAQLFKVQLDFYRYVSALQHTALARTQASVPRPKTQERDMRLPELLAANIRLADTYHFEEIRARAEQAFQPSASTGSDPTITVGASPFRSFDLEGPGTVYAYDVSDLAEPPKFRLVPVGDEDLGRLVLTCVVVGAFLGIAWFLGRRPASVLLFWEIWPEVILALGLVLYWVSGSGLLASGLLLPAIAGRAVDLQGRLRLRQAQVSAGGASGSGATSVGEAGA